MDLYYKVHPISSIVPIFRANMLHEIRKPYGWQIRPQLYNIKPNIMYSLLMHLTRKINSIYLFIKAFNKTVEMWLLAEMCNKTFT